MTEMDLKRYWFPRGKNRLRKIRRKTVYWMKTFLRIAKKRPPLMQKLQLMEHSREEGREYSQPHKIMRKHAVSDLLASGCCDDLLKTLTRGGPMSGPREIRVIIKWYTYIPVNRKYPRRFETYKRKLRSSPFGIHCFTQISRMYII